MDEDPIHEDPIHEDPIHEDPIHEDKAREGLEHLQAAAREVIAATRAMLEVVEDLVEDPDAVRAVVSELGGVVTGAFRAAGARMPRPPGAGGRGTSPDDEDGGGVQRIRVS